MGKKIANAMASVVAFGGGIHAQTTAAAESFHEMATAEQAAAVVTDAGETADDVSSADDVAKKAETVDDQLTSKADAHKSPEPNPDWQEILLEDEGDRELKKKEEADQDLALGDREEVSSGNITAPAPSAGRESAVTSEEQAQEAAPTDEERAGAAAEADQERAAIEDEEQYGGPAEENEPVDETWVDDETWVEDDADVNDPDID